MHDMRGSMTIQRVACAIPAPLLITWLCALLRQQPTGFIIVPYCLAERIIVALLTDQVVDVTEIAPK